MSRNSRLGGLSRTALLRGWLLYLVWLCAAADGLFSTRKTWSLWPTIPLWILAVVATISTLWLLYRHHRFAGPVGFLAAAPIVYVSLTQFFQWWTPVSNGFRSTSYHLGFPMSNVALAGYCALLFIVPVITLARHVASRHRLMLYEANNDIDTELAYRRRRGGYYFVTMRG